MKPFSRDWAVFAAGWLWAMACGMGLSCLICSFMYMRDVERLQQEAQKGCPNPLVEMAEYRGVVHALDRCYQRLDEEQQNVLGMRSELDRWGYIERVTHQEHRDAEINCQGLLHRALQDVWFDAESALYDCYEVKRNECWCPFEGEEP